MLLYYNMYCIYYINTMHVLVLIWCLTSIECLEKGRVRLSEVRDGAFRTISYLSR